jgi:hypothetical protein
MFITLPVLEEIYCPTGQWCVICRDLAHGRAWRQSVRQQVQVPGGTDDWDCPRGHAWGSTGPRQILVPPRPPGPGSLLSRMIREATGIDSAGCPECDGRVAQMNAWGYSSCVRNWRTIRDWLAAECRQRQIRPDARMIRRAIAGAFKSWRKPSLWA